MRSPNKHGTFTVTSIQSLTRDDKTPTAETFSPLGEKPKIITNLPAPKRTDFVQNESDPYSELCSEQLDNLDTLEEVNENISNIPLRPNNVSFKLEPLDLKKENETKTQKLTTPGRHRVNLISFVVCNKICSYLIESTLQKSKVYAMFFKKLKVF